MSPVVYMAMNVVKGYDKGELHWDIWLVGVFIELYEIGDERHRIFLHIVVCVTLLNQGSGFDIPSRLVHSLKEILVFLFLFLYLIHRLIPL
jgi:hypothetical protein